MLPTEPQWQRGAQGDTNRAYPWGDEFDLTCCNSCIKISRKKNNTSPVTRYEGKGDSLFGIVDMCGNVGEWCSTNFMSGLDDLVIDDKNSHVTLRGGPWYSSMKDILSLNFRFGAAPSLTDNGTGFRLAHAYL